jgi:hypothetical protein
MGKRMKKLSDRKVNPIAVYNFIQLNYPELDIQPLDEVIEGNINNQNRKMIRNLTAEHKDLWFSISRIMRGPKKKNNGESENV